MVSVHLINFIKKHTVYRIPQEIHVETVVHDYCYSLLLTFLKKHPNIMCMLTGPLEPEIKARLHADFVDDIMTERYAVIAKRAPVGLHAHVMHPYALKTPDYKTQLQKISEAKTFLENIGLHPVDFSPGWWNFNHDTVRACENLGIKRFHYYHPKGCENSKKLLFIRIYRSIHDYNLEG